MNSIKITVLVLLVALGGCRPEVKKVSQVAISKVKDMPSQPRPYKQLKWREKAINFDQYVFDSNQRGEFMPLIWLDSSNRNVDQTTFGLYTVIGDVRQGYQAHPDFHESLTSLGALMSAGLSGIDKTNQNGFNFVKMSQNYFNSDTGWNIMMNNKANVRLINAHSESNGCTDNISIFH